jgi:hypothetical protein
LVRDREDQRTAGLLTRAVKYVQAGESQNDVWVGAMWLAWLPRMYILRLPSNDAAAYEPNFPSMECFSLSNSLTREIAFDLIA